MRFRAQVGKVHPYFFHFSNLFSRFNVSMNGDSGVLCASPFFSLSYDLSDGYLRSDDADGLHDFATLVVKSYGKKASREMMRKKLHIQDTQKHYVINVGVCLLEDSVSGWDGSVNAVWPDDKPPAPVVDIYYQYWSKSYLIDAWKLNTGDLLGRRSDLILPNLVDSMLLHNGEKKKKIEFLIQNLE